MNDIILLCMTIILPLPVPKPPFPNTKSQQKTKNKRNENHLEIFNLIFLLFFPSKMKNKLINLNYFFFVNLILIDEIFDDPWKILTSAKHKEEENGGKLVFPQRIFNSKFNLKKKQKQFKIENAKMFLSLFESVSRSFGGCYANAMFMYLQDENIADGVLNEDGTDQPTHFSQLDPKNMKVTELRVELNARNLSSKGMLGKDLKRCDYLLHLLFIFRS